MERFTSFQNSLPVSNEILIMILVTWMIGTGLVCILAERRLGFGFFYFLISVKFALIGFILGYRALAIVDIHTTSGLVTGIILPIIIALMPFLFFAWELRVNGSRETVIKKAEDEMHIAWESLFWDYRIVEEKSDRE